ncbi:MAG TPA: AbrB/MazE/SpoVT family DNA-binding domain-containing protein [Nitrososphaerales archaeon]|nr:AbrB/MazE/SpoVT family DNA-binding domain-containing protein [Nitrososphaerales archaeon]
MTDEKHIKVSTQGRITIPKQLRDRLKIRDGQPIAIRPDPTMKGLVIELLPMITDYK